MGIAVVDGKYFDSRLNSVDIRNLMIQGKRITGMGYIPDEDEDAIEVVNAYKSMLVPMVSDFVYMPHIDSLNMVIQDGHKNGIQQLALLPNALTCAIDSIDQIETIKRTLLPEHSDDVAIVASASLGNLPDELSDILSLIKAGAKAIYFDRIIENESLFHSALEMVNSLDIPIVFGPMTTLLYTNSHLNAGQVSFEIGVRGEHLEVEDNMVQFVLNALREVKNPIHFQVISSPASIHQIRQFNHDQQRSITLGVSPFHCMISDQSLLTYNTVLKFNPPLRDHHVVQSLMTCLVDDQINHLTSLHCPSLGDSQSMSFFESTFGTETLSSYIHMVSHILIDQSIKLDKYQAYLRLPSHLNLFGNKGSLSLNSPASFSVIAADKYHSFERSLLQMDTKKYYGGLVASVKDGTLFN